MKSICATYGGKNTFNGAAVENMVELHQTGFDRFDVFYGLSVKRGLSYSAACAELGASIMHLAACDGRLDNRTRAEAKADGDKTPVFG